MCLGWNVLSFQYIHHNDQNLIAACNPLPPPPLPTFKGRNGVTKTHQHLMRVNSSCKKLCVNHNIDHNTMFYVWPL